MYKRQKILNGKYWQILLEMDFYMNETFKAWRKSLQLAYTKILTQYDLSSNRWPPPKSDHQGWWLAGDLTVIHSVNLPSNQERFHLPIVPQILTWFLEVPGEKGSCCQSTYCRVAVDTQSTYWPSVGWVSVEYPSSAARLSAIISADMSVIRCGFSLVDTWPIPYKYFTDSLLIPYRYLFETIKSRLICGSLITQWYVTIFYYIWITITDRLH